MSFSRGSGLFRPFSAWTDEFCRGTMNTAGSLGVENLIIPGDSILFIIADETVLEKIIMDFAELGELRMKPSVGVSFTSSHHRPREKQVGLRVRPKP